MNKRVEILPFKRRWNIPFDKTRCYIQQALLSSPCSPDKCRLGDLLHLSFNFSTHLLQAEDEEDLLATVLVAVTAGEGLAFNRAFILEKLPHADELRGVFGVGPPSPEAAAEIWGTIEAQKPSFQEMVTRVREEMRRGDAPLSTLAQSLHLSLDLDPAIRLSIEKHRAVVLRREESPLSEIFEKLGVQEMAAVPLAVPPNVYGVILVDNFVTREPIGEENLQFLEMIASLTSLALNRLNVYRELEEKKFLLVEAERLAALGELASKVSHEIRNPISAVGGLSRLLLKKGLAQEVQTYLDSIIREAERLEKALEDLFEFIKPVKIEPQPIGLYRLLQTALTLLQGDFREAGIHVSLEVPEREPVICVDPQEMQLVLIHLLKNALEAMPEGGVLRIAVKIEDEVEITITDSGLGIPPDYINRVTEPFFTTKVYGSGLGLSVAKRIVELHGGSLELRPVEPSGTKAVVKFPLEVLCNGGQK